VSVDIVVIRLPGDKKGPDIIDPLLSNAVVAVIRGTADIQDNEPIDTVALSANYRTGIKTGQILEILDILQGEVWRGKVIGITHHTLLADRWTDLDIERVKEIV